MLLKMLSKRFGELGERSKEYEGSKVWSILGKRLDEMLVDSLGDHLGDRLGEIKTIFSLFECLIFSCIIVVM
jgi:hypothetical protein